ncbi:MAG: dTDP-4-amino-4,6-dideoxygalactose transaminase [Candidatus Eremiobacteraeota bacterium]|nr:dTDP-4-amino-4,6-dideoxygalactose transaminase [Candidatus Eremiobacteraeota bacterium]
MSERIPFNKPFATGAEARYLLEALDNLHLSGDGPFTKRVNRRLEESTGAQRALLTHSCTAALEMSALLSNIVPGDEILMPSFTFVSTANAFVLRGGVPVFVDIRPDTLNIDESLLEAAITPRTKAIVAVHYAGVACEMEAIMGIARAHGLAVIEDAAQGFGATYRGRALGSIGALGALSFHETKNIISGEGGALLVNDAALSERAEIIREKGTNRSAFLRGSVDKYTWVDIGSSYLPSEIIAAFLWAQLESADALLKKRLTIWQAYHERLEGLESRGLLRRPIIPPECGHNAHMYYVLVESSSRCDAVLATLLDAGIGALFHYVPLHSSPAGRLCARAVGTLPVTTDLSARLVRLPMFYSLTEHDIDRVCALLESALIAPL